MKRLSLLMGLVILLGGCAVSIRTTGFLDRTAGTVPPPKGALFTVLENAQAPNPILDREIKGKIEKLLAAHGYRMAGPDQAHYVLVFSYGISPGLRLGTTTSYSPPQTQVIPVADGKGGRTLRTITTPGSPYMVPTVTDAYTKQLTLKVIDAASLKEGQKERVIWMGDTLYIDASSDLRYDIDYLLVVTFKYFGQDTGQQINTRVDKDNPDVKALRQGP